MFLKVKNLDACIDPFSQIRSQFLPVPVTRVCLRLMINTSYSRWEGWITLFDLAATEGTTNLEHMYIVATIYSYIVIFKWKIF